MSTSPGYAESEAQAAAIASLIITLEGTNDARYLCLASFAMLVYEYCTTLDQEIEYFWSGRWTITRILYLSNRYWPLLVFSHELVLLFAPNLSLEFCDTSIRLTFVFSYVGMLVVQAILALRIYHLFPRNKCVQILVICLFLVGAISAATFIGLSFRGMRSIKIPIPDFRAIGCSAPPTAELWKIFVPTFIVHTFLFLFTTLRAILPESSGDRSPVARRLLRDGGLFYVVVFITVGWTVAGSLTGNVPSLQLSAIYSNFMLATVSIAVSRLMLSIRSLAACLAADPSWVLNNVELSRVHYRRGATDAELLVEIEAMDALPSLDAKEEIDPIRTTRVGVHSAHLPKEFYDSSRPVVQHVSD